jgi:peptidoglycan/LPS O-acetylase OafA/YrhL
MRNRNSNLDVLRAIAVALVIFSHGPGAPPGTFAPAAAAVGFFRQYGSLGVDLFFVLSGFLVSGLLFREWHACGSARVGRFLIRRGFKIYPAFYVFIFVTALLRLQRGDGFTRTDLLAETLFIQNYGPHLWSHTWSLAVEEHFYLLLAGLVTLLQRRAGGDPFRPIPVVFLATTACVLAARWATFAFVPYSNETHRFPTHLEMDSLFFGVLLSYFHHSSATFRRVARTHVWLLYSSAAVCLIAGQTLTPPVLQYVGGHALTYGGFGALVVAAVYTHPSAGWATAVRPIATIGEYSYSIYLWHTAVYVFGLIIATKVLGHAPTFVQTTVGYTGAAFAFGILMARVVERPALRIREALFPDRARQEQRPRQEKRAEMVTVIS